MMMNKNNYNHLKVQKKKERILNKDKSRDVSRAEARSHDRYPPPPPSPSFPHSKQHGEPEQNVSLLSK